MKDNIRKLNFNEIVYLKLLFINRNNLNLRVTNNRKLKTNLERF